MAEYPVMTACPSGTLYYDYTPTGKYYDSGVRHKSYKTCYCEEHCSWHECYLVDPPNICLIGTNRVWAWNSSGSYWFAMTMNNNGKYLSQVRALLRWFCLGKFLSAFIHLYYELFQEIARLIFLLQRIIKVE